MMKEEWKELCLVMEDFKINTVYVIYRLICAVISTLYSKSAISSQLIYFDNNNFVTL